MQSRFIVAGSLAAARLLAPACGSATQPTAVASPVPSTVPSEAPGPSPAVASPSPVASTGTKVAISNNRKFGRILVDGSGRTIYLFLKDSGKTSTCYMSCAQYWPPVLTNGAPTALSGVAASLLGTAKRSDGTVEVTYAGHPL